MFIVEQKMNGDGINIVKRKRQEKELKCKPKCSFFCIVLETLFEKPSPHMAYKSLHICKKNEIVFDRLSAQK